MKISESWLREWLDIPLTGDQLVSQLTMAGIEVDSRSPVAGAFDHVVVARVVKTTPHPQADKLSVCMVDAGEQDLIQVVCGAPNVRDGLSVALARPGATLPGDFKIKESILRGVESNGMLCSAAELGMSDAAEGIIELPSDATPGTNFREYYALDDAVLDLDLTPNRADCLSVLGIARELSALNQMPLQGPALPTDLQPDLEDKLLVRIDANNACPHYCGRIIKGIDLNAATPLWVKECLRRSGLRALHPVVDVMNYVMLELGQPLHAFDLNTLQGDIHVRFAKANESLVLLDERELMLNEQVLVIADNNRVLAMAGIMGGLDSSVQETTRDIFIESAFFTPLAIGPVARHYNLSSDSSLRYERGVDPELQQKALDRATSLILEIAGGMAGPITDVRSKQDTPISKQIELNPDKVKRLSGLEIDRDVMKRTLTSLGMTVSEIKDVWFVDIPSYRYDLLYDVDLVEEIIRLYGYDKIPSHTTTAALGPVTIHANDKLAILVSQFLSNRSYSECVSYSFVDPSLHQCLYPESPKLELLNPISSELSEMRAGLWPGLIAAMIHNMHRQQVSIRLFEIGTVFEQNAGLDQEQTKVAGLVTGEFGQLNWAEPNRVADFFDLKGDVEALYRRCNVNDLTFVPAVHPALHPGQSAQMVIQGQSVGWVGALHPRLAHDMDLSRDVVLFELSLESLIPKERTAYRKISKYPQVRRDLSFLLHEEITAAQIQETVHNVTDKAIIKSFDVFDVYQGKEIPVGKRSMAISMTFQDDGRTLVYEDVICIINAIIKALTLKFNITLRE